MSWLLGKVLLVPLLAMGAVYHLVIALFLWIGVFQVRLFCYRGLGVRYETDEHGHGVPDRWDFLAYCLVLAFSIAWQTEAGHRAIVGTMHRAVNVVAAIGQSDGDED